MEEKKKIKTIYKEFEIEFNEYGEEWKAKIGESSYVNKSLEKVKKYIDNLEKKDFKRIKVIVKERWGTGKMLKGEVTSIDESYEFWVTDEEKGRAKHYKGSDVFIDSEHNVKIFNEVYKLRKIADEAESKVTKKKEELVKFNPEKPNASESTQADSKKESVS